jgi:hypothetical protein
MWRADALAGTARSGGAAPARDRAGAVPVVPTRGVWIINPLADGVLLIGAPLIALLLGGAISVSAWAEREVTVLGHADTIPALFIATFITAHLFIVVFRSHLNRAILVRHPVRFLVVPIALFAAMSASRWVAVSVSVLATWWDVYHSGMQTFGLGRIYDAKGGNDARAGRRLDQALNLLLYAGPILAGATLMDHVHDFAEFEEVGAVFFTAIPACAESHAAHLTWAVVAIGLPFLAWYVFAYWRLARRGYRVSAPKVALLVSTAICSILAWGFNTFGEAFFIMNFFHALQYFALVWTTEKTNLRSSFRLDRLRWGTPLTFCLFLAIGFGVGLWGEIVGTRTQAGVNVLMVIAVMHFWYDGFIWSVRRGEVG